MELNHRPIGLQPIALPLSYSPRTLVQLLLKEIIARALWTRGRFRPGLHQRLNGCVRVPPPMHPATYNNPLKKKERKKKKKKKKKKKRKRGVPRLLPLWSTSTSIWRNQKPKRGDTGIEPATSCTQSRNHTTRPITRLADKKLRPVGFEPTPSKRIRT